MTTPLLVKDAMHARAVTLFPHSTLTDAVVTMQELRVKRLPVVQDGCVVGIVTDGEVRRESYSNRFATALEGVDAQQPGRIRSRTGQETVVPRVVGRIRRARPVEVRDMEFLRRQTDRTAKITLPGPFTLSQQARNEFYRDADEMAMDFAAAVNALAQK